VVGVSVATHLHRRKYTFCGKFHQHACQCLVLFPRTCGSSVGVLRGALRRYLPARRSCLFESSSRVVLICALNSASPAYQTTLGLHLEELCRCGQDVISFAGPMDDLDGPMDRSKKRFVVHIAPTPGPSLLAQDRNLTFPLSGSSGSRHVQRILCACMVRRHQGDTGGDCDAGIER